MCATGMYASDSDTEPNLALFRDAATREPANELFLSQELLKKRLYDDEGSDSDATMIVHEHITHSEKVEVEEVPTETNKVTGMAPDGAPAHARQSERFMGSTGPLGTAILVGSGSLLWGIYYTNDKRDKAPKKQAITRKKALPQKGKPPAHLVQM